MSIRTITPVLLLAALVAVVGSLGCSKSLKQTRLQNLPPTVRLTYAPVDTTKEEFYVYKMQWVGYDPDGRVVNFQYAIDPPRQTVGAETLWVSTPRNEQIITFTATKPEFPGQGQAPRGQSFHIFVLRAVDNNGAVSPVIARAFLSFGVAPVVQVLNPRPSSLLSPAVTPAVRIQWEGKDFVDPNGFVFEKPVKYKFKLYKSGPDIPWVKWIQTPDSLRVAVAPEFAGWDSCGPEETEHQFTNLVPSNEYLFVVVAFGRSGAYSPIFSLDSNMLRMFVGFAGQMGPRITMFNSYFSYQYPSGGFPSPLPPEWAFQLQVPANEKITFNWVADPPRGSDIRWYRWALDIERLDDETARANNDDLVHWSQWSLSPTFCRLGPFVGAGGDTGEVHNWYVEAQDINGLTSLGWVQFRVFKPTFANPLLVVNDTRFNPDQTVPGRPDSLRPPSGTWPMRAELDTFLYAVGGVRWRMTPNGTLSRPGIFRGYRYDTLGTRSGLENPTVPLSYLGQYRHIVWLTDLTGAEKTGGQTTSSPMTALRYMTGDANHGRQNTLATWVTQGGELFSAGGGFGHATNAPWNKTNDGPYSIRVYASDGPPSTADLVPGRFMYDLAHWRSEFRVYRSALSVRFGRYDQKDPTPVPPDPIQARRRWTGRPWPNPAALYTTLPREITYRDPSTDQNWPYRTLGDFYVANPIYSSSGWDIEFLTRSWQAQVDNDVIELDSTSVDRVVMDTLYMVFGSNGQINAPGNGWNSLMTHYHGWENASVTHLGAGLWAFRKTDCQAILDCVLQNIWHLPKDAPTVAQPVAVTRAQTSPVTVRSGPARSPARPAPVGRSAGFSIPQRLR